MYRGSIQSEDLERDAEILDLTKEQFVERYLIKNEVEDTDETKNKPCDFLQDDGNCKLGECRPERCKKYPYTDQLDRLQSLYSVLNAVEVCLVVFEIYERLKKEYGFRYR